MTALAPPSLAAPAVAGIAGVTLAFLAAAVMAAAVGQLLYALVTGNKGGLGFGGRASVALGLGRGACCCLPCLRITPPQPTEQLR
jgi:hypothetical protein